MTLRLRMESRGGSRPPMFAIGVTDLDVAQLTKQAPLQVDLAELGGHGVVVIFHGATPEELRRHLATVLNPAEMASITSTLDQLGAHEREVLGIEVLGVNDAPHDGEGADEHRAVATVEGLTREQTQRWCDRVDELLAEHPPVGAHLQLNMAGEFVFSPATCPLCRELAELEVQARNEILAATKGAT